ncbi:MAG: type II toxin-antitoxin system HipA family toxin [Lachnospiraceae bacterium]|nr:type II toxin-antitoxin system HipA family toxin [Lachnospiraceae bacterium]
MRNAKCTRYCLKYKDETVLVFNTKSENVHIIKHELLPLSIINKEPLYGMIKSFCAGRVMARNRKNYNWILKICGLAGNNEINICIKSEAASLRDNYWICRADSNEKWKDVSLYRNMMPTHIGKVALTGIAEGSNIITRFSAGELMNKGTKAKCFLRNGKKIFMCKAETEEEINSEVISYYIAKALGLPSVRYNKTKYMGMSCSICRIMTSEENEMVPCRDVLEHYDETRLHINSLTYKYFMETDPLNFIRMQLFDYITLNTDRNRDNYGLLMRNRKAVALFPVFDHDSCFKGKSANGIYFPSGITFHKTICVLKEMYKSEYGQLKPDIIKLNEYIRSGSFKKMFFEYKTEQDYLKMLNRTANLI